MTRLVTTQAGRLALARGLFRTLLGAGGLCLVALIVVNAWRLA